MAAQMPPGNGSGPNILPIPPPLEFPYPPDASRQSAAPTQASSTTSSSPPNAASGRRPRSTDRLATADHQSRPKLPGGRPMTERAPPPKGRSFLRLNRRATGFNLPAAPIWSSDSDSLDSSSSSEDEDRPRARLTRSKTSGRSHELGRGSNRNDTPGHRGLEDTRYSRFSVGNEKYKTRGKVSKRDGRLNISVNETANSGYLAKALGATLHRHLGTGKKQPDGEDQPLSPLREEDAQARPTVSRTGTASTLAASVYETMPPPRLNIVVMVIGSRGDIQPFLKIGKVLKEEHGHRVRIATHPAFKDFVERDTGLEFFSVGGDPAELMAFMVKNPGLVPSVQTVKAGEIGRRREAMFEMFQGFWRACINATDEEPDRGNIRMMYDKHPFVADAIIANPPSFAHIHCAERLGIPLHLMFTFPYTPTQQFPHPLANIKASNVDTNYTNFMSYPLVEMMTWQGLGDLVNRFRVQTLGLEPVSTLWAPGQLFRLKVPYTYLWSPGLVPKPPDWGPEIDIAGFVFLDLASSFKPPESLEKFMAAGEAPVYIGFGSIVVDDPDRFTSLIFEAVKKAGVRALVSKGWGGLGGEKDTPDNVYMLENTPHDWLFPRVRAVVHHGGAGTTAIGMKCGKPTMIVPFFGDQPFWGAMVARAGAGAHEAIPYKRLTADKLAEGIQQCLSPEAQESATKLAKCIAEEGDGAVNAVKSFHRSLPLRGEHSMRCSILDDRVAVWSMKNSLIRLSALAADILVLNRKIKWHDLRLIRHYEWNDFEGPGEPITGGGAAFVTSVGRVVKGLGGTPVRWTKRIKKREARQRKRKEKELTAAGSTENRGGADETDQGQRNGNAKHGTAHRGDVRRSSKNDAQANGAAKLPGHGDHGSDARSTSTAGSTGENIAEELVADAGIGFVQAGEALAKAPMDLSLAIAQGFHNAPRLYGDDTVRRPTRISGFHSGLKAAGEEFIYGVYDGFTGVVLQPYRGAKSGGVIGFFKGVGKGVGGFVLKDFAAIFGPFAYTLKGIHKELQKGRQPTRFIESARMIQGQKDLNELSLEDRERTVKAVDRGWLVILEIRNTENQKRAKGLKGRIELHRERKRWRQHGAYENIQQANKALEAQRKGHSLEKVFRRQRKELKVAAGPRKSTMTKAQREGKAWKEREEKEKHGLTTEQDKGKVEKKNESQQATPQTGTAVHDKAAPQPPQTNGSSRVHDEKKVGAGVNGSQVNGLASRPSHVSV